MDFLQKILCPLFGGQASELSKIKSEICYINYQDILNDQEKKLLKQLNGDYNIKNDENTIDDRDVDDAFGEIEENPDICFDKYLDLAYSDFYESTLPILKRLDDSKKLLENGTNGVPKVDKVLNWTTFNAFCENQKRLMKEAGIETKGDPYLDNWVMHFIIGKEKVYYDTNFKCLKQNAYKPNIDLELKKLEEDIENDGTPAWCPKYFKTWITYEDAYKQAKEQITNEDYKESIKNIYIGKGGIWITNVNDTTTDITMHIPQGGRYGDKYINLWEESIDEYISTMFSKLGWEFDETRKKRSIIGEVCTKKEPNPNWPYKALYIDTINYNPWEVYSRELQSLKTRYNMLPDKSPMPDKQEPKKLDGKPYEPLCDKNYPIDYQQMFGLPAILPRLMTVPIIDYDVYWNEYNVEFEKNAYDKWITDLSITALHKKLPIIAVTKEVSVEEPVTDEDDAGQTDGEGGGDEGAETTNTHENSDIDEDIASELEANKEITKKTKIVVSYRSPSSFIEAKDFYKSKYAPNYESWKVMWVTVNEDDEDKNEDEGEDSQEDGEGGGDDGAPNNDDNPIDNETDKNKKEKKYSFIYSYKLVWLSNTEIESSNALQYGKKSIWNGKVGLSDGYAYVPLGFSISCQYVGIPIFKDSIMIPGIGFDYGTTLAGAYIPNGKLAKKLVSYFPYQNTKEDGKYYWLQNDIIWPWKLLEIPKMYIPGKKHKKVIVDFDIYQKIKLPCGFPKKCGEMTTEELDRNGVCGLEEFLNNPPVIDPRLAMQKPFDPKEIYANTKKLFAKWKDKLKKKQKFNWDLKNRLKDNKLNKKIALQQFTDMAKTMFPNMGFIDVNCLRNALCETQRKAKDNVSIEDMSDTLANNVEATKLLINDVADSIKDSVVAVAEGIGELAETAVDGLIALGKTFNLYKLCPRRFSDWLMESGELMGLPIGINPFIQLQNIFTKKIMESLKGVLGECMKQTIVTNTINSYKSITLSQKQQLIGAFQNNDLIGMKNIASTTKIKDQLFDKTGALNFSSQFNTPTFNMGKLSSFGDNFTRNLISTNIFNQLNQVSNMFNFTTNMQNNENDMLDFIKICDEELKTLKV